MCDRESLIARCLLLLHRYQAAQTHLVAALKIHPDHLPLLSLYILALSAPTDEASRDVRSAKTVLEKIKSTRFPLVHAAAVAMLQAAEEGKFEDGEAA